MKSTIRFRNFVSPQSKLLEAKKYPITAPRNTRLDRRFSSMEFILNLLSSHHGRRQYPMRLDLRPFLEKFRHSSLDWHDLKSLSSEDFILLSESFRLSAGERNILALALHSRICGVVLSNKRDRPAGINVCTRRGLAEFNWRCGEECHSGAIYFEDEEASQEEISASLLSASAMSKYRRIENGMVVETRPMPNFEIVGRRSEAIAPRSWKEGDDSRFSVKFIGYDFRVHNNDPRYLIQIHSKEELWKKHAQQLRLVLLEVLETYATDKGIPQPLDLQPGEVTPDASLAMSFAQDPDGQIVEFRMVDRFGSKKPWFMTPIPREFRNGVPSHIPVAPTVIIKINVADGNLGLQDYMTNIDDPNRMKLQISIMFHQKACFFWAGRNEESALKFLTDYSKQIPYSLPLYLYYRVDSLATLHNNPDAREFIVKAISSPKNGLSFGQQS